MNSGECLVTGATGFLGRHVVQSLSDENQRVTVLQRHTNDASLNNSSCQSIRADLAHSVPDLTNSTFNTVFHLAGLAHVVPRNETERARFFQVNTGGTKNLLEALSRAKRLPKVVVLASTVAVYGKETGTLLDENTAREANDAYGASKKAAEDALIDWGDARAVRIAIIRLPLVVGRGAPGNLGAMVKAIRRGRYFGVGAGAARRSMVLAQDVARVLPRIAEAGGVFHLTDGHHPSFAELEMALTKAFGRNSPHRLPMILARSGARIGDVLQRFGNVNIPLTSRSLMKMTSTLTFSDEKARRDVNWKPSAVLEHAAEFIAPSLI